MNIWGYHKVYYVFQLLSNKVILSAEKPSKILTQKGRAYEAVDKYSADKESATTCWNCFCFSLVSLLLPNSRNERTIIEYLKQQHETSSGAESNLEIHDNFKAWIFTRFFH